MGLARIGNSRRVDNFTWPGFVDALATLLMVIIFVLMVFVLVQVNLAYRVSGQDATLGEMRQQLASLGQLLSLERKESATLAAELALLTSQLETSKIAQENLLSSLTSAQANLKIKNDKIVSLEDSVEKNQLALEAALRNQEEQFGLLQLSESELFIAKSQAESSREKIDQLEQESAASRAEVVRLTNSISALRLRIEQLTALLSEKEQQAARDKVAIASLGKSLNNALAGRVQELQRFRSEFFGRLREVLKGRDDVQVVGDRFVFQSEVLFAQGQANIGTKGEEQLTKLAVTLNEIAKEIPEDINWVLQVDGHTDNVPVRAGRYVDNWDLSTERALSVVRFLNRQGLPSNRLAAAGYGEFQPLDNRDIDEARRLNRRIELKITQRTKVK